MEKWGLAGVGARALEAVQRKALHECSGGQRQCTSSTHQAFAQRITTQALKSSAYVRQP